MKALIKTKPGRGSLYLKDIDCCCVGPREVKIKVEAAGICGTDLKIFDGDSWCNPPVILGHEFSGTVVEIGTEVEGINIGDRVVSETAQVICGNCYYCNTSNYLMCENRLSLGYGVNGAFAEYCIVREGIIHKLPDDVDFDCGALCEPTAVAVHAALGRTRLQPTDIVVVMGPGTIGLLVAQVAKSTGVTVVVAGTSADRKRLCVAKELGIDYTINIQEEDPVTFINKLTDNRGADVVYECSGAASAIGSGMNMLKRMGKLVQIGLTDKKLEIEYSLLPQKEISLIGTFGHRWVDWETSLELISKGRIKIKPLITHKFPLTDWGRAFELAKRQEGIKILLRPSG